MSRTITSVIGGAAVSGAPGGTIEDRNPARLDDIVAHVAMGNAETFANACAAARAAQPGWADVPAP
ncbi:MAG TPA: aldehyde dehydrogenase family protein, partial [Mycobacteriales bacterium]|nr:aldehyde dehydrogenase family protein [Mycobacteriales bacterium]